jgi:biopolymer transport protein TolR
MAGDLTPFQRAYIRKRTKHEELDPSEMAGELNIVPFLDIVTNIIMFLLATTQAVLAMAQITAALPQLGGAHGGGSDEHSLNLNVTIVADGIIVAGSGGKLAPGCANTATGAVITVPKRLQDIPDPNNPTARPTRAMDYDWQGLTECVARVKAVPEFSDETQVIIGADPQVPYEALIHAMDAVSSKGADPLFPDIMLSAGVR